MNGFGLGLSSAEIGVQWGSLSAPRALNNESVLSGISRGRLLAHSGQQAVGSEGRLFTREGTALGETALGHDLRVPILEAR